MRLIDADALHKPIYAEDDNITGIGMTYDEMDAYNCGIKETWKIVEEAPTVEPASPWHRVEEPPKEAGEYIVAYHPCYWEDVDASVTKVGIDNFRGKSAWAKKKFQRVTHWMEKPEPPKEDA